MIVIYKEELHPGKHYSGTSSKLITGLVDKLPFGVEMRITQSSAYLEEQETNIGAGLGCFTR